MIAVFDGEAINTGSMARCWLDDENEWKFRWKSSIPTYREMAISKSLSFKNVRCVSNDLQ